MRRMRVAAMLTIVALLVVFASAFATAQTEIAVWLDGEPGTVNAFTELAERYMELNPDVKISITFIGSSLFSPTLVPALSAGEGPDLFQFGTGPGQPQAVIASGLVRDLTPYYYQYGWDKVIPEEVVSYTSSNGKLWAVGDSVETTVMFYNKALFEEYGLEVPETWAELEAIVETFQAAGFDTPIGLGGADKWPISHWQSMLFGRFAGPEGVDNVMYSDGRWDEEPFVEAMRFLKELTDRGWFGPNPLAVGYPETMDAFWNGEIPMTFTGPWVISEALNALGPEIENFSVFQIPSIRPGQKVHPTEDIGGGWYISSASKNPDVAADVLNFFLFTEEGRKHLLASGESVPVGSIEDILPQVDLPKLWVEVLGLLERDRDNVTIHAFLDTVQPANVTNVTYDGLQAVMVGMLTPEQFVAELQAAWETAKAAGEILKPGGLDR